MCSLRVFAASITRVAFVNDFLHPDITWALRRVYVCTIIERNLAELIADLPTIFPLLRSMHKKGVTIMTHNFRSSSTTKSGTYGRSTTLTIGSSDQRYHASKRGEFAAYGKNGQFTTIQDGSDDEIPLRDQPRCPGAAVMNDERGITVQVNIDMESQERGNNGPVWPAGNLRPLP